MIRLRRLVLTAGLAAALAVPVAAQEFSNSYTFLKAVRERDGAVAQGLVQNPSAGVINTRDASTGEGALHILVRGRDLSWLAFMLEHGARPDLQAHDGTTPLGLAAQLGWVEGAEQLLARRASVDLPNGRGETPLILAVQARQADVVRLLIGQGADPNRTDSVAGYSALDYARQDRRDQNIARLLEAAPRRQASEVAGPTL